MYNLGLQLFSAFLQMSLQQQLNLLRLQVGLIAVAKKLIVVLQSLPLDCRGYLEL